MRLAARLAVGLLAASLTLVGCGDGTFGVDKETQAPATYAYVIPIGAGEALDTGTPLEILPARLDASVGEVLEIVNDDERGHTIGPFFVGAYETMRIEFTESGRFEGGCTVHPSGEIVIVVT